MEKSSVLKAIIVLYMILASHLLTGEASAQGAGALGNIEQRFESLRPTPEIKTVPATITEVRRQVQVPAVFKDVEVQFPFARRAADLRASLRQTGVQAKSALEASPRRPLTDEQGRPLTDEQVQKLTRLLGLPTKKSVLPPEGLPEAALSQRFVDKSVEEQTVQLGEFSLEQIKSLRDSRINEALRIFGKKFSSKERVKIREATTKTEIEEIRERKIEINVSSDSKYYYDSNAFTSNINTDEDRVVSFQPGISISFPIGDDEDTFSIFGGPGFDRYDDNPVQDGDTISAGINYTKKLKKTFRNSKTKEFVALSFGTLVIYGPGFSGPALEFYKPAITWRRSGMPFGRQLCGNSENPTHCNFLTISLKGERSWSNRSVLDKTSARFSLSYDRSFKKRKRLSFSASGSVTGSHYDDFPGGRDDATFGGEFSFNLEPVAGVNVSAGMSYTHHVSSISRLKWDGYKVLPGISVKFKLGHDG